MVPPFDPPANPEGATARGRRSRRKIFWALGYNQVEYVPDDVRSRARSTIDPKATMRRPSGKRTPFTQDDMRRDPRARRRATRTAPIASPPAACCPARSSAASSTQGTRPDDPNDLVPHEHRRELRALRVFGAWTNLTDLKAGNTLDTLVTENGRGVVKHYLQDVGSTFGMAQRPARVGRGWEYFYEGGTDAQAAVHLRASR